MKILLKSNLILLLFISIISVSFSSCKKEDKYIDWKVLNEKWYNDHKADPGFKMTDSGLMYKVIREGNPLDRKPSVSSNIVVTYEGKLIDGTVFDGGTEVYLGQLSNMIKGWQEGLVMMNHGAEYEFYIPWTIGYGAKGGGNSIPPYSTLIFKIELINSVY